jgi:hypothetical protein
LARDPQDCFIVRSHSISILAALSVLCLVGCVDAPITPDQLEPDGQLRGPSQSAFSAQDRPVAQTVSVSAVLAAEPAGALEDRTEFPAEVGTVHLHLRADGLMTARPVVYRWTHDDIAVLVPGMLAPTTTLDLATSFEVGADQVGTWLVEVLDQPALPGDEPRVLFQRQFQVLGRSL